MSGAIVTFFVVWFASFAIGATALGEDGIVAGTIGGFLLAIGAAMKVNEL